MGHDIYEIVNIRHGAMIVSLIVSVVVIINYVITFIKDKTEITNRKRLYEMYNNKILKITSKNWFSLSRSTATSFDYYRVCGFDNNKIRLEFLYVADKEEPAKYYNNIGLTKDGKLTGSLSSFRADIERFEVIEDDAWQYMNIV